MIGTLRTLVRESESGRDVQNLGGIVSDERHGPRCVLPSVTRKVPKRVRTTRDVERNWSWSPTVSFELPVEVVLHNARTNGKSGLYSSLSEPEQIEDMMITIAKFRVHEVPEARNTLAGKVSRRRRCGFSDSKGWTLEERPAVSGGREKTQREELQCHVENDTVEGPAVKTMRILLVPTLWERGAVV